MKQWQKISLLTSALVMSLTKPVMAQSQWEGACLGPAGAEDVATLQSMQCVIANILNVALTILAFVGFGMFVYGAILWLVSGGNPSNLEKAKNTFVYAVLGLVFAMIAFVVINLISHFMGTDTFLKIKFLSEQVIAPKPWS